MKKTIGAILVFSMLGCTQAKNEAPAVNSFGGVVCSGAPQLAEGGKNSVTSKVIQNLSRDVILATYMGLSKSAADLHAQVLVLESARSQENLNKARDLWRESRKFWESTEAFIFGPVESLSIDPQIDTWPLNVTVLESILRSGSTISPEVIRSSGTDLKGFHTVEYILFGNGKVTNQKDIAQLSAKDIEYLKATTQILAENTAALTRAWTTQSDPDTAGSPAYISLITDPSLTNPLYSSNEAVIAEFLNGMIRIADEVGNGKIADPLGDNLSGANPAAEESPFSWNSVTDFSNNIRSIQNMYEGNGTGLGIKTLLEARSQILANSVSDQIKVAIAAIQNIAADGQPFGKAILNEAGRVRVKAAQDQLNILHTLLLQEVRPCFQK